MEALSDMSTRIFPKSKRGDVEGLIQEIFGEDHPYLDLHFVCEALFEIHDRISLPMITNVLGDGPCEGLFWLSSEAADYLKLVIECDDPEMGPPHDIPATVLRDIVAFRKEGTPIIDPTTGKQISDPNMNLYLWFEKTASQKEYRAAHSGVVKVGDVDS